MIVQVSQYSHRLKRSVLVSSSELHSFWWQMAWTEHDSYMNHGQLWWLRQSPLLPEHFLWCSCSRWESGGFVHKYQMVWQKDIKKRLRFIWANNKCSVSPQVKDNLNERKQRSLDLRHSSLYLTCCFKRQRCFHTENKMGVRLVKAPLIRHKLGSDTSCHINCLIQPALIITVR